MNLTALVIDDDAVTRIVLCHMLRSRGWHVEQADDVPSALSQLEAQDFDLVVSDYRLPSGSGVDVLDAVKAQDPQPSFVLVTGIIEHSTLSTALRSRVAAQLTKPVGSQTLDRVLGQLFPGTPA